MYWCFDGIVSVEHKYCTCIALSNLWYHPNQVCFILKEIVVCSYNMLCDFFVRFTLWSVSTMYK